MPQYLTAVQCLIAIPKLYFPKTCGNSNRSLSNDFFHPLPTQHPIMIRLPLKKSRCESRLDLPSLSLCVKRFVSLVALGLVSLQAAPFSGSPSSGFLSSVFSPSVLSSSVFSSCLQAQEPTAFHEQNPTGTWKGQWRSESTGHSGPMRVVITPSNRGTYQARFTGRFAAIIPFAYRAELVPVQSSDGTTRLTSSKKLGPILGDYQMQTQVAGSTLSGGFQAAGDRGSIQMQRVR